MSGHYRPIGGVRDEMVDPDGRPRTRWEPLLDGWAELSTAELVRRFGMADRHVADMGVSYRARADFGSGATDASERPWPLSHLPLLLDGEEWRRIAAGIAQRARLLEAVLADVYGPAKLVSDGALPAAVVSGSPDFLHPLVGAAPPGGRHLLLYAADLGRGPDGRWWVLGDRTQAPSGAGYALENRLALSRAFPDLYRSMNVERLAPFFQAFREGLAARARRTEPRICLLTPGPLSETYFEQAYLARYLGFLLVEGGDLVMREDRVHVRTIAGLKRADVLWRRIDGDFADPLELNGGSELGIPGLLHAMRRGQVVVGNAPGAGVVESPALMSFLPGLARTVLDEDLLLPNVATWWCGQANEREAVLSRLDDMAIGPAFRQSRPGSAASVVPAELDRTTREAWISDIRARGGDFVGQEVVKLSTTPVWEDGRLEPRPFTLRVFAAATADGWHVLPGGFCRISDRPDVRALSMQEGARSCDVWVLSDVPVELTTLLPTADKVTIRRVLGNLPSRAADNLFWLGRYFERTEATLRVVRTLLARMVEPDRLAPDGRADAVARLIRLLVAWGAAPAAGPGVTAAGQIAAALHDPAHYGSAAASMLEARRTASVIRERLSTDAWRLIGDVVRRLERGSHAPETEGMAHESAEAALRGMAAFSGLAQENMFRGDGWRFLEIGRRLERGITTCRFVRTLADPAASQNCLDVLLDLTDSPITYRSRYLLGAATAPVLDMVVLDQFNPRSVAFQLERLDDEISRLPQLRDDGMLEAPRRISRGITSALATADVAEFDRSRVLAVEQALMSLSDAIAARYFLQGPAAISVSAGLA